MEAFTVCFFGHRIVENPAGAEMHLEGIIKQAIREHEFVEFLVGRDGDFDLLAASVVKRCQREIGDDNSALVWVLPYPTAELKNNEEAFLQYYDEIEVLDGCHFKAAFQTRNRAMVDRAHLCIFYVSKDKGGAAQTLRYAKRQGKALYNIAEEL